MFSLGFRKVVILILVDFVGRSFVIFCGKGDFWMLIIRRNLVWERCFERGLNIGKIDFEYLRFRGLRVFI